jgi:hypothetical protein
VRVLFQLFPAGCRKKGSTNSKSGVGLANQSRCLATDSLSVEVNASMNYCAYANRKTPTAVPYFI